MADTLAAIVAAGIVYDRNDFADPQLEGPTALTVTADGRVYGHLATWGTPHIGMGRRVTPPKSPSGYRYFHQGVVKTADGDLPVGKLTLGTGHAPVARGVDAMAAAAHYDNTGTVVAAVRAGEDEHGIWLAGRLVPGVSDERVDELRRSGVSGDWRGVNGQHELVAALAVNVPGFPIPRTEELVASGTMALVAAGIVVPPGADLPQNVDEFNAVLAAAVKERVDIAVAEALAERDRIAELKARRERAASKVQAVVASARREKLAGLVAAARVVKTEKGAKVYGKPIGHPIGGGVDDDFEAENGLDPNVDDFGEDNSVGEVIESPVPARTDGDPGEYLEEDQVPSLGANGGELVSFENGVAKYADGTETDGQVWRKTPVAAAAEQDKDDKDKTETGDTDAGGAPGVADSEDADAAPDKPADKPADTGDAKDAKVDDEDDDKKNPFVASLYERTIGRL